MRKVFFVLSLMLLSIILTAISRTINVTGEEIKLSFENVRLKSVEFYSGEEVKVESSDKNVLLEKDGNDLFISSEKNSKIDIILPESKSYIITKAGMVCNFDQQKLHIETSEGDIIKFQDGELTVINQGKDEVVIINSEGIFVQNEDEKVAISGDGILVEGEETKNLSGFWGKLLGSFVKVIVKTSLSFVGDSPAKIVTHIVNEDKNIGSIDWSSDQKLISKDIRESFHPQKGDKLDVSNLNGTVTISGWDYDYVDIEAKLTTWHGKKELDKVEIEIIKDKVWQINTKHLAQNVKASCDYEIKIPAVLNLQSIETTNGSINLSNAKGKVILRASNGSLKVNNLDGTLEAFTSNGSIKISEVTGKVNATTNNGRIEVQKAAQLKNAITTNASITVKMAQLKNDVLLSTSNGSINVYLSSKVNAEIIAKTSNSNIESHSLPIRKEHHAKSDFKGTIGKGSYQLNALTSNAGINFYKLEKEGK